MAKLKRPTLVKPSLAKPSLAPKTSEAPSEASRPTLGKPRATLSPSTASLASRVTTKEVIEIAGEDVIFDEAASEYATVDEKIASISAILEAEDLPVARLRSGLKDVMACIRDNEDAIMDLEPSDISTIVAGYMRLASEEERRIVEGAKPKSTKKRATSKSAQLKKMEKLQKEINIDDVEF